MDRREHLKLLLTGSIGAGLLSAAACTPDEKAELDALAGGGYGRTPEEARRDADLKADTFYTPHEMATIAILVDIIIPRDEVSGSATDAGVPGFIEFITKDMPSYKIPMRGGLMWLDIESRARFGSDFVAATAAQRMELVDDIAWPETAAPAMMPGVRFFNRIRGLAATGFYTTRMGFDDLGYKGNTPNEWDGVPPEVLAKHGLSYDNPWKDRYLKKEDRYTPVQWPI
jgi:hypothetical protein